ncbi:PIN domain-containing protein [uncultured Ruminococcus sp.]|uniref:PIN domain-containing protein n=1 Tax=uncultured Ruminococcus sp. TaxID=165186 RepID=UPI0026274D27|nr:PIN domain-containing protein [uncultured Ruminococcus sp.]
MRFYIDFENVGSAGLIGIESLSENDCVRIYYSNNPNVDMNTVKNMTLSSAKISFVKIPDSIKMMNLSNALDIVLLTDISRNAGTLGNNYAYVISNDKGFDLVISEINQTHNIKSISRCENILSAQKASISTVTEIATKKLDENALNQLFSQSLSKYAGYKDKIINIVKKSKTRSSINNNINKSFDSNQTKIIMSALKPIIKNLPGQ